MSMDSRSRLRWVILTGILLLGVGVAGVLIARITLAGLALSSALRAAGASEVSFAISRVSPWRVEVADLGFRHSDDHFSAAKVTLSRAHWWKPSLGAVRVEDARIPVRVDRLLAAARTTPESGTTASTPLPDLPLEEISFDGVVVLATGDAAERRLQVSFFARQEERRWAGDIGVSAPGFSAKASGKFDPTNFNWEADIGDVAVEIGLWREFMEQFGPLPLEGWELGGSVGGSGRVESSGGNWNARGKIALRAGRAVNPALQVVAEGIEGDVEFTDFSALTTKPAVVSVRELRAGNVPITDIRAEMAMKGVDLISVSRFSAHALGGAISTEPFELVPSTSTLEATVLLDGIRAEQALALTEDLPAKATGLVSGRIPLRIDSNGFRLGTGWLGLKPGSTAELELNAAGLLTAGSTPNTAGYTLLQRVETGLLKLKVTELRLDIRPPGVPATRTATLRIAGAPVDPTIKAPVTLDLNVNGPIESLLNLGIKSGARIGTKP